MKRIIRLLERRARRSELVTRYRAITGERPDTFTLNLLADPWWTEHIFEMLKAGMPSDELADCIECVVQVQLRTACARGHAVRWVVDVRHTTGNPVHAITLAHWMKPEERWSS